MAARASIEHLPAATRSRLRSTQILTSLPQIISELLQNSLDSGATQVDIGVNCEEWGCWVRDNGTGISKDGMSLLARGSEEGRYGTSKAYNAASLDSVSTFGFRGEALASAADLSCLEISSRTSRSRESWSVILKGGKGLYNGPSIRWRREQAGTVVCIRDAFYNLPIRRLSHPNASRTFDLIRQDMESFALVFPRVSFSLDNTNGAHESTSGKTHITRIPKTTSSLTAFRHLYGRALAEHIEEIDDARGEMELNGFISLDGAHSKAYQFLYINRHPVATCDIHRIIDNKFASSSFAKHAFDETGETSQPRSTLRRSPRKTERRPVYVLNLTIPPQHLDNCIEPAKARVQFQNQNVVSSFVSSVIQSFLIRHGFASDKPAQTRPLTQDDGSPLPRKRRKVAADDDEEMPKFVLRPKVAAAQPLYINPGAGNGESMVWKDPSTGETFVVDTRTGNSYPQDAPPGHDYAKRRTLPSSDWVKKTKDPFCIADTDESEEGVMPQWLQHALKANKVYGLTERKIPSLGLSSAFVQQDSTQHHHACGPASHYFQSQGKLESRPALQRRFRKEDLKDAHIISQVDRKFIACLIRDDGGDDDDDSTRERTSGGGRALVLIDQHAADERVRVERFLKELCLGFLQRQQHRQNVLGESVGVKTKVLSPPVPVLLTRHEVMRLAGSNTFQQAFECWGITFENLASVGSGEGIANDGTYSQVFVHSVPTVVSEKLLMADELRELIKGFLAKLEEDDPTFSLAATQRTICEGSSDDEPFFWMKALRWCPRELLDLVNSKACRGAIMFNDTLTVEQCQRLVKQLSETALPFQCAHGRPSLVPLANVGGGMNGARQMNQVEWDQM